jgi:hypothetical protein
MKMTDQNLKFAKHKSCTNCMCNLHKALDLQPLGSVVFTTLAETIRLLSKADLLIE